MNIDEGILRGKMVKGKKKKKACKRRTNKVIFLKVYKV